MAVGDKLVTLDELKLVNDRIDVTGVTGVKGNAESSYRTGNVNLTPANIGAVNKAGDTMTGDLTVTQATGRVYLLLTAQSDQAVDLRFSNENSAKWAISSRSSSDNNFIGLFNHMTSGYAVRVANDNTVSLLKPLPVGSGGTGATTAAEARTNLGITPANIGALATSGGTITGTFIVTGTGIYIRHSSSPIIYMQDSNGDASGGIYSAISNHRLTLRAYHTGDTNYEDYYLPTPGATGSSSSYQILTSKSPVTVAQGGTGETTAAGMRSAVLYNTSSDGTTAYPTAAGVYRTTGTLPAGMPTGANKYGVLLIVGAGTYYMHIYADAAGGVYIAEKGSTGAPETWRKVTTTNVAPIS